MRHDVTCAVLVRSTDPEKLSDIFDMLEDIRSDMFDTHFPYLKAKRTDNNNRRKKALANMWKQTFGDPNDPETMKRVQKTIDELKARKKKGKKK